jgi:hypothetical protein
MLTPENGTGEGLTCGLSWWRNTIQLVKIFSEDSVKGACGLQYAIIRQKDCLRF